MGIPLVMLRRTVWVLGWIIPVGMATMARATERSPAPPSAAQSVNPPFVAQVNPGDRFPDSTPLPRPLPPDTAPTPAPPAEPLPPADARTPFPVTDIQVVGSTLLSAAELAEIVAPYENRDVTLAELQQAADAITQRYLNAGYITSRAVLTSQTIVGGVVQIQVIEGELEEIQVEGTETLQGYIRDRVSLGSTRPLNQAQLEDQLRLLRADPLFDTVEASLRAGTGLGRSILIVRVTEARPFTGTLTSDNYSPVAVGDVRFGARFEYRNLAGWGDTLFTSATWSDTAGSKVYDLGYRVPLNPMNGTLQIRLTPNNFRITDPNQPTFGLVEGATNIYEVTYRQPLIRSSREEFALSTGIRFRQGSTLLGGFITDSTRTTVFSFGQDYTRRDISGAWALRSQFRVGREFADGFAGIGGGSEDFFSWNGQVQRVQLLGTDHRLILQSNMQLSTDSLPGSEQFFLGGGLSVRGYAQNQRFGDNGIQFSIEDQITVLRDEAGDPLVQIAPFLEGGYAWFNGNGVFENSFLLGTGVGVLATPIPRLTTRFDFALPLIDVREFATDPPDGLRFYFSVGYQL